MSASARTVDIVRRDRQIRLSWRVAKCNPEMTLEEKFSCGINLILPVGQISKTGQASLTKYSDFQNNRISPYPPCLVPLEGRLAIVTDAGRDAVDADGALTNALEADGEVVWS
ncbi:MAG: hypothetical protein E7813_13000 [Bradyrhizobium sp.]|uniref:hypothetical protein n=1 Tax=Bradyrhizobium sp. TaxID=376 RepID=UPI0011F7CEA1|nr:hypothetical protein [Bradyrhizobium sp.]THD67064.1 MAG: hypothetical protein E7813_13000 [Bradyrhizobium sp.]